MATGTFTFNFELEDKQGDENKPLPEEQDKVISAVKCDPNNQSAVAASSTAAPTSRAREITVTDLHWLNCEYMCGPHAYIVPRSELKLYYINTLENGRHETVSHISEARIDMDTAIDQSDEIASEFNTPDFATIDKKQSDLIPGVYEGGLKVWDGSVDLLRFLVDSNFEFSGRKVLELGCGVGLPGICALMKGAEHVSFQDYNAEVINYATIPSVMFNLTDETGRCVIEGLNLYKKKRHDVLKKCAFYCGDWALFTDLLIGQSREHYYDVIMTSETIYSVDSQPKLLSAIKRLLNPKGGVAFVAAKTYYFGVGGTLRAFEELIQEDGYFNMTEVKALPTSVPRKIIKLVPLSHQQ